MSDIVERLEACLDIPEVPSSVCRAISEAVDLITSLRALVATPKPEAPLKVSVKTLEWEYRDGQCFLTYTANEFNRAVYWINQQFGSDSFYFTTMRCDGHILYDGDDLPAAKAAAQADYERRILSALVATPKPEATKPLTLNITQEWFEKQAAKEGDLEIGAGVPDYLPGFVPSAADRYYNRVIAKLQARIVELEAKPEAPARLSYDLRLQIGNALDRLVCDDSTPEQVDTFIKTFTDFGLSISAKPEAEPVGYVTKNELTKLRLGVSCVDLFGKVVPTGFEMVPLYAHPPKPEATEGGAHEKGVEADRSAIIEECVHFLKDRADKLPNRATARKSELRNAARYMRAALTPSPVLGNEKDGDNGKSP